MKIAVIIPPFMALPALGHGGTERIAEGMIDELLARGIQVTVLGAGNCQTKARFEQIFPRTISEQNFDSAYIEQSRPLRIETAYIAKVMKYLEEHDGEYDVIYNHMRGGYLLLPLQKSLKTPVISILHLPLFEEVVEVLSQYENPYVVTISNAQRKPAGDRVNFLETVYNGCNPDQYFFNPNPEDYFVYEGAMGEHKSPHLAIEACKKANVKLILAGGKIREPYFSGKVEPLIDDDQIKFIGEVKGDEEVSLLKNAKGLLMPITWEEPFGLIMIEAMSCGTPVIGFNHGAVPEVIEDGKTGFVVEDVEQMAEAIKKIDNISREACRKAVEEKFTFQKMTESYLEAFYKIGGNS